MQLDFNTKSHIMRHLFFMLFSASLLLISCNGKSLPGNSLADPKATEETKALYNKMKLMSEKGIMIGHQDDLAYGIGWIAPNGKSDVYKVCSDYPAVFGWDLGHLEMGLDHNLDSVPFADILKYSTEMSAKSGIITYSWHLNNPITGGDSWDVKTPGVVASILPNGINNAKYNIWLDQLASFFSKLKDNQGKAIPVLFRPFHEHTGSWFWWGKDHCTPEEYKNLWVYTFDYLTKTKNLHNLIFVFSTAGDFQDAEQYSERYPGDNYVDIIGFDYYQGPKQSNEEFRKTISERIKTLQEYATISKKPAALTEIGYETIPDSVWWTQSFYPVVKESGLLYALFWRNAFNRPNHFYMPYPGQISEQDFKKFYSLPSTLFLSDLN